MLLRSSDGAPGRGAYAGVLVSRDIGAAEGFCMLVDHCLYGAHAAARAVRNILVRLRRPRREGVDRQVLRPAGVFRVAAEPLGIEVRDLGHDAFELRHGAEARLCHEMTTDQEDAFTYWVTGHKHMTFELLRKAGITEIPRYRVYTLSTAAEARRDFRERGRRVVTKPCFGTAGGEGVTVGIETERELRRGMYAALCHDRELMVEDFVEGDSYRLLVCSGRLISAVKRIPPSVVGDGTATIRELIDRENARRSRLQGVTALHTIKLGDGTDRLLRSQGKSLRAVPRAGERVFVTSISNFGLGGEAEEVTDLVCADTVDLCRRVADALRIRLAGIDLITSDIRRPLRETGGVINEVNTSPGLLPHYAVRNREKARDVAREVLLDMFPSARPEAAASVAAGTAAGRSRGSSGAQAGLPELRP